MQPTPDDVSPGANPASVFFGLDGLPRSRQRVFEAMTRAVAAKGYARVTVADVVAMAGVSRRTFYEHFSDKEECFLALYETGCGAIVRSIRHSIAASNAGDVSTQVRVGVETYTALLASDPDFAHALLVDVLGAGPRAITLRREVFTDFMRLYGPVPEGGDDPYLRALVGGISEIVQEHIWTHGAGTLRELAPALTELALAVMQLAAARRTA